jgi:hypothetical protein
MAEYNAEPRRVAEKIERLKALRLAKEAAMFMMCGDGLSD